MNKMKTVLKRAASCMLALAMTFTVTGVYMGGSSAITAKADETTTPTTTSDLKIAYVTDKDGVLHVFNTNDPETVVDSKSKDASGDAAKVDDTGDGAITSVSGAKYTPKENSNAYRFVTSKGKIDNYNWGHGKYYGSWYPEVKSVDIEDGTKAIPNMREAFQNLEYATSINIENLDTSNVTDMSDMFEWCRALTSLNLSKFDTSNVTDMRDMFYDCRSLTSLDLSKFNTSNVTDMRSMFEDCSSLTSLDLSKFDTGKVEYSYGMFIGCSLLGKITLGAKNYSQIGHSFSAPDKTFSGKEAYGTWALDSETAKETYEPNQINSAGTWYAQEKKYYAVYNNGTLYFLTYDCRDTSKGVTVDYNDDDSDEDKTGTFTGNFFNYDMHTKYTDDTIPWKSVKSNVTTIEFVEEVSPSNIDGWFTGMTAAPVVKNEWKLIYNGDSPFVVTPNDSYASLKKVYTEAKSNYTNLQSQLDAAKKDAADKSKQLDAAKKESSNKDSQIAELKKQLADANTKNNDLQTQLTSINAKLADLQKQLDAAKADSNNKDKQIADVKKQLDDVNTKYSADESKIKNLQSQVDTAKTDSSNKDKQIADLKSQLDKAKKAAGSKVVTNGNKKVIISNNKVAKQKVVKVGKSYYYADKNGNTVSKKKVVTVGKSRYITKKDGTVYTNTTVTIGKTKYTVNNKGVVTKTTSVKKATKSKAKAKKSKAKKSSKAKSKKSSKKSKKK